ncbi:hypothetical protein BAE44_0018779 [Dichanthelium oligosanthes]|uniref:Chalcone/stilbene synthase C-terminal domain-containing protein n=1 Tax=Dichanthelium oligosanthes TaxID=888268 RepID=A0A1E5V4W7_9POAL|nr:hypothetical protein BAE44_0018779 [Dichanthelium oligosanthes]
MAFIGDGASAVVVGADSVAAAGEEEAEKPLFEIVRSKQLTLPGTSDAMRGLIREMGMTVDIVREVPSLFAGNVEAALRGLLGGPGGGLVGDVVGGDWNKMFWSMHYPGGRLVLDKVEAALGLDPAKMRASRARCSPSSTRDPNASRVPSEVAMKFITETN